MTTDPALIRGESLSYGVNDKTLLDAVSLEVAPGEFLGIIGPNGAGKTTLLRVLVGSLKPSTGRVLLRNQPLEELKPRQRAQNVSYLSQEGVAAFAFPVLDVVLMGRYPFIQRFSRESESDLEKAHRALSYVGLSDLEDRFFNALSGGEQQLVLFARVLAQETDLLLLDEPTSNLDIKHEDQLFSMTAELVRERKAVIAAVHNLNVASQYCSRLILLDQGRIAAQGRPQEVLQPKVLDPVYNAQTAVTPNTSTGSLTVNVIPRAVQGVGPKVHLIGGAGTAINLTRELSRLGYRLTGGIAHSFDADQTLWEALEIEAISVDAFSHISEADVDRAAHLVREADLTVLCPFPIGAGNLLNLELAARADRLIVLEPGPEEPQRGFFAERGQELFQVLLADAEQMTYGELAEALESGLLAE